MKQSEIQEVINSLPDAVFVSNARYNGDFIVKGFVMEPPAKNKSGKPIAYALTQQIFFDEKTQTTSISTFVHKKPLRIISHVFSISINEYNQNKIQMLNHKIKVKMVREQNIDAMNEIKPQLSCALKALNIENNARIWESDTTFKIELNVENAEALLALLNTIAAEQVK